MPTPVDATVGRSDGLIYAPPSALWSGGVWPRAWQANANRNDLVVVAASGLLADPSQMAVDRRFTATHSPCDFLRLETLGNKNHSFCFALAQVEVGDETLDNWPSITAHNGSDHAQERSRAHWFRDGDGSVRQGVDLKLRQKCAGDDRGGLTGAALDVGKKRLSATVWQTKLKDHDVNETRALE